MRRKDDRTRVIRRYSPRATLVAIGMRINALKLLESLKRKVVILRKSIHHTPSQKLTDAFIAILAGRTAYTRLIPECGVMRLCSARSAATLAPTASRLAGYGAMRLVRDVLGISGLIEFDAEGVITHLILNKVRRR